MSSWCSREDILIYYNQNYHIMTKGKLKARKENSNAFLKAYASHFAAAEGGSLAGTKSLKDLLNGNILGSKERVIKLFVSYVQTPN